MLAVQSGLLSTRRWASPCAQLTLLVLPAVLEVWGVASSGKAPVCQSAEACQAHMRSLTERLNATAENMTGRFTTMTALDNIRSAVVEGRRVELPPAHREHLEKGGSPLIGQVSFDAKHRPVSTNVSKHLTHLMTLAGDSEVLLHTFMPLKRAASSKPGGSSLLVTVDVESRLSVHTMGGEALLVGWDLGHEKNRTVKQVVSSPIQDNHFVVTADDAGEARVHNLKVVSKKVKNEAGSEDNETEGESVKEANQNEMAKGSNKRNGKGKGKVSKLQATANFSCAFVVPNGPSGEVRKLKTVLPIERGSQVQFMTGDSAGGIAIFHRNGTMRGRVKVTDDPGGVRGLLKGQGQSVLFYSSHSFGFFSSSQIDVQYPPCTGWNSPLFDVALDPSHSYSRVILALSDGDVLVFTTTRGKSKACDLTLKFPRVSSIPFQLQVWKGHVVGLPTPLDTTERKEDYLRELYFFNQAVMEAGYGTAPSRTVPVQISFKSARPEQPAQFALQASPSGSSGGSADRTKGQIALRFAGAKGVELFELSMRVPPPPKAGSGEDGSGGWGSWGGGGGSDDWGNAGWLNWFPKIAVFGIALVGVVMWNVRKVTAQKRHDRFDDFDDEAFKERLRERKEKRREEAEARGNDSGTGQGLGGSQELDSDDR